MPGIGRNSWRQVDSKAGREAMDVDALARALADTSTSLADRREQPEPIHLAPENSHRGRALPV